MIASLEKTGNKCH